MGLFRNKKKGVPPHTWYPEILHWQEGDEVFCWNIYSARGTTDWSEFHRFEKSSTGYPVGTFIYKGVSEDGRIFVEDKDGNLMEFEFYRFIRKSKNESLKSRNASARINETKEYMELISNFQNAFNELQEADNHPKRLGIEKEPK
ncbi:MAG: hypothetical protein JJ971_04330 [Balneolaceae bacterium]|nr:hypothetical protein [Balneolaceae bacterium]MBO6545601.1 hypothetical protein [Balneolaceae bacterium]MBO6646997.1 hypothetical protein [Balneolaceae bacterium]